MTPLYLDQDIAAFDKPPGLASIPERNLKAECLLHLAEAALGQKLFIVHRLDKEVSGLICFARHAAAHRWLNARFAAREVEKRYLLLALGRIETGTGQIDAAIRQFGSGRMGIDPERGKPARTRFTRIACYANATLVHAFPQTGRRHQLRVHFYSIGHPIAGDRRYGDRDIQAAWPRLMLHAAAMVVLTPAGQRLELTAPPPDSFSALLARLEPLQTANPDSQEVAWTNCI
ncbi:MAG TPA: RluA family pseudouridine synthase [bacterium]|nr:RluA family pseudouridine synthase [bacterium]HPR86871.1 RluA family pseudouridine synthase [bacterium]